ncbi:hypothetical protein M153_100027002 [Pseudoloma neurophilia]|uniref:Uncharacterized protein n=1 Tax=Pseudoloma neurophilia TaxID=146866 RepID=A0A0R0M1F1_9MICR|nr:hypothetical protein M153_100027002 [Pseudoloma neurophilia]
MVQVSKDSLILDQLFQIIKKNNLKQSIYYTCTVFHRKIQLNKENFLIENNNFKLEDLESDYYILALLALSCKANDVEMPSSILHSVMEVSKVKADPSKNKPDSESKSDLSETKIALDFLYHQKKVTSIESYLPLLFNYELHTPCPFIRVLGLLIILNERGILIQENVKKSGLPSLMTDIDAPQVLVDILFQQSVNNLLIILKDSNILNYKINELAISAIPLDVDLFDGLKMWDAVDRKQIQMIRDRNLSVQ